MPLSQASARRELHHRDIDMKAYQRDDGLYDVEAHLVDTKPFPFKRFAGTEWPADAPLHDLWVRLTIDNDFVVRAVEAASDVTPFGVCKEAERTLSVLVGEPIARGWSNRVKQLLRGAASCTHLMELMIPLGTTAMQGIRSLRAERSDPQQMLHKIDSCYAYGRDREIVQRVWPEHHRPAQPQQT